MLVGPLDGTRHAWGPFGMEPFGLKRYALRLQPCRFVYVTLVPAHKYLRLHRPNFPQKYRCSLIIAIAFVDQVAFSGSSLALPQPVCCSNVQTLSLALSVTVDGYSIRLPYLILLSLMALFLMLISPLLPSIHGLSPFFETFQELSITSLLGVVNSNSHGNKRKNS